MVTVHMMMGYIDLRVEPRFEAFTHLLYITCIVEGGFVSYTIHGTADLNLPCDLLKLFNYLGDMHPKVFTCTIKSKISD